MKFLVVIGMMFSTVFAWAGAVEWNTVYKVATYDCDNVLLWYSEDASSSARLNMGLYLNWNAPGEISLSGAKYGSGLGDVFVGNVLSAALGDLINEETTRNLESYFCHDKLDYQEHATTYSIAVETGADYYLMFAVGGLDDYQAGRDFKDVLYGWVHLGVNDESSIDVLGSAVGLDGQTMWVGMGDSVPEPSSTILLLIGLAGLGLKRKGTVA